MIEVNVSEDGQTIDLGPEKIQKAPYGYIISDGDAEIHLAHAQMQRIIHFAAHHGTTARTAKRKKKTTTIYGS